MESIASEKRSEPQEHFETAELQRFMGAESSRDEARAIVRHLLARCPECLQVTRRLGGLGDRVPRGPR
ncbi:MAG TPA: hypothetical protein VLV54_18925 [Thermoanaerobaculia bacterium]|nr:hypothetical protein [Thermoanaerobaculia bacterium]